MAKTKKAFSAKRVLALALALIMALSVMPAAFAATPTGPVSQTEGNLVNGVDAGHYVSFRANLQNFTFIQTEDNQNFQFQFRLDARKNANFNYCWIYERQDRAPQTLSTPIGKSFSVTWDSYQGGLPTSWKGANITVDFVSEGSKVYDTALRVTYDGRGTQTFEKQTWYTYDIPLTVTVLDKRALNSAISAANAAAAHADYYTEATWADVTAALANAQKVAGNVVDTQTVIDRYANALQRAVDSLEYKAANYTDLDAAKDAAEAILHNDKADDTYTIATMAALREKYAAAQEIPTIGWDIRNQPAINKAASELNAAVSGMVKFANYATMQAAVNAFEKLNASYYDPEELAALKVKVDAAKKEMLRENKLDVSQQKDVNARAMALMNEIRSLKVLPANYEAFNAAVANAKAKLEASDIQNYTAISVKALNDAYLASASIETGKDITYQATIDAATKAINDAIAGLTLKGADYKALDAAIADAQGQLGRMDISDYTDDSVSALRSALDTAKTVSRELTVDQQQVITDAASALLAATRGLTLKGADYTALDKAISDREAEVAAAKEAGIYTDASISRVETAIAAAKEIDRTYTIKEQTKVNDALAALTAVKLEKKPADYSKLNAAIEAAQKTLNSAGDEYTEGSKAALSNAIKAAQAVVAAKYDITQQEKVNEAVTALESVKLVLKDADYSALNDAIKAAESFLADPETEKLYTEEAIQAVRDALDEAKEIAKDLDILHQDEITAAANSLVNAVEQAKGDFNAADLAKLQAAVDAANQKLAAEDIEDYTQESRDALAEAITEAQAMIDRKPNVTEQNAVNAKAAALAAMTLTLKGANYDSLDEATANANTRYNEAKVSGQYTDESLAQLKAAIDYAEGLSRSLTIKDQKTVDDAEAALNVKLVYKGANLAALNEAIVAANAKLSASDISNYTEASVAALRAAVAQAEALVKENPDITKQSQVDEMAASLSAVKLVLKDADFTALDAIIKTASDKLASGDINTYTPDSVAALRAALEEAENIDRSLTILDQADVDAAVANVQKALDAMKQYDALTSVAITNGGVDVEGDVLFVKVPWYTLYKKNSTELGIQVNSGAEVKSVKWSYANWSIDKPEATIETPNAETTVIRPNGKGIGARSCWVTVTVEDVYGNVATDTIKVRFHKWNWQAK
ncbi:MAG: hypothetical protein SPF51_01645 [Candidatus Fimivicinus sp.]|nr:hypothetical protein [Oscillospiraceae bacterium]MDY5590237.1 hypothetical protein [Candidatus Fimivicinus sp.]